MARSLENRQYSHLMSAGSHEELELNASHCEGSNLLPPLWFCSNKLANINSRFSAIISETLIGVTNQVIKGLYIFEKVTKRWNNLHVPSTDRLRGIENMCFIQTNNINNNFI